MVVIRDSVPQVANFCADLQRLKNQSLTVHLKSGPVSARIVGEPLDPNSTYKNSNRLIPRNSYHIQLNNGDIVHGDSSTVVTASGTPVGVISGGGTGPVGIMTCGG